jgi:hypothetical protein
MIERMGRRWGCHTCGSRMWFYNKQNFKFVGDHMPPKSIAQQLNNTWLRKYILGNVKFRFYTQCVPCSNTQGSVLSKASQSTSLLPSFLRAAKLKQAGGGQLAHNHGLHFRLNHLAGGILAGMTVLDATGKAIRSGNQKRFENIQRQIAKNLSNLIKIR